MLTHEKTCEQIVNRGGEHSWWTKDIYISKFVTLFEKSLFKVNLNYMVNKLDTLVVLKCYHNKENRQIGFK